MSGRGSPTEQLAARPVDCSDLRVAVVAASWHPVVMDGLLAGALRALADFSVSQPVVVRVPGSFELPVVAAALAAEGAEAVIALGVVIRGGTPHFEFVCGAATDGLSRVALDHGVAVGFGLLTCETEQQALDRAGLEGSSEDKGYEATAAGLITAQSLRSIRQRRGAGESDDSANGVGTGATGSTGSSGSTSSAGQTSSTDRTEWTEERRAAGEGRGAGATEEIRATGATGKGPSTREGCGAGEGQPGDRHP